MDYTGKVVVPFEYDGLFPFVDGVTSVTKDGVGYLLDTAGKVLLKIDKCDGFLGIVGIGENSNLQGFRVGDKRGLVDRKALKVIVEPTKYTGFARFCEGVAAVYVDGIAGLVDTTGKEILPCEYDGIWGFEGYGYSIVQKGDEYAFINNKGEFLSEFAAYDEVTGPGKAGLVAVSKDGKWGFVDKTGKVVVPFIYDWAENFWEDISYASVQVLKDPETGWMRTGLLNAKGEVIVPLEYDWINPWGDGTNIVFGNRGRAGVAQMKAGDVVVKEAQTVVSIDGKDVTLGSYNVDGREYFMIRDFAAALVGIFDFGLAYDVDAKVIKFVWGEAYEAVGVELKPAEAATSVVRATGTVGIQYGDDLAGTNVYSVYTINGRNYMTLVDLVEIPGFGITYEDGKAVIDTAGSFYGE